MAIDTTALGPSRHAENSASIVQKGIARRYAAERRFRLYGMFAILFGIAFLVFLFGSIVSNGYTAFVQTSFKLDVPLDSEVVDPAGTRAVSDLRNADYTLLARKSLASLLGADTSSRPQMREVGALLSRDVDVEIRNAVLADPSLIGKTLSLWVLASGRVDSLMKGQLDRELPAAVRKVSDQQLGWLDKAEAAGFLAKRFNTGLFTAGASSNPETAGIGVAMVGSLFMMLIVLILSVPLGVAAAIYLEEFATKNLLTDIIEVNINNLAAVPSIVFGLLGLAIFINFAGLPRSASLVGGLVLTLMTLPTIIIATRAALKAVPPSIREAAYGVGASKMQTIMHHVLPLAIPGILTGTIVGLAQALGETAPLLMIGMVAFVVEYPTTPLEPATALPVQIYMWATSAERGFVERTSGAALILVAVLICMNLIAVILRRKFERRW
ncbi:phosphate ABC transporter permease PstA [Hyphomicrobium sp.]|uniref:phosphate ABC transporter permease PstA n=1 Tax=Hyphomicrobium sp. TaxID=82 RepID=UPI0025C194D3|nr:phosphate ABC transporter permease PstA [Hyphomicrobium sp.]MCC7251501.1 phosphate ABC transporter permease PstA [Hyphomicrobium sp.]